ncbi:MAG TPA: hypothetical protein DCS19_02050, partial [Flavobacterium sp.]|nr:hypothetical protein [Flavobacterium sp.]
MAEVNIKSDFLGIKDSESKIAVSWSWVPPPVEVITIKNLYFDMPDEYNGYINILLSNNDIIVYRCYETCTSP